MHAAQSAAISADIPPSVRPLRVTALFGSVCPRAAVPRPALHAHDSTWKIPPISADCPRCAVRPAQAQYAMHFPSSRSSIVFPPFPVVLLPASSRTALRHPSTRPQNAARASSTHAPS
ncbi:hypothetical protein AURDEDRAFT_176132 [Auricularia subglabra TFB-10046 SS5]|uniref:Uncharacterized protein n=1 Tax=Auricularia subglabra (strain TFB-10046 / SS5) TaxID=717982 RepID=J0D751_AURST|nr:hypothetical protein AURDEDRAFT_176132 [Auricularia subglabra TFB-10046 SS5]